MAIFPLSKYMPGYKTRITYRWKVLIKSNSNYMCLINLQERTFLFSLPIIHRIYLRLKILQQSSCWCWISQHTTLNWFCAPFLSTTQMRKLHTFVAGIYVFQFNNRTIRKGVKYVESQRLRHQNKVIHVFIMSVLLILSRFHTFFLCFYC